MDFYPFLLKSDYLPAVAGVTVELYYGRQNKNRKKHRKNIMLKVFISSKYYEEY
jgi:hypothetical protein